MVNAPVNVANLPPHLISSAIGTWINASDTESVFSTDIIRQFNALGRNHRLRYYHLSSFLKRALIELGKKHELRRTIDKRLYVTKHESYSVHANSSLVRKVYITPSTILYEGPYQEEKCVVTRHYVREQDRFLRVNFRDEG